jgi:hypothetical protein
MNCEDCYYFETLKTNFYAYIYKMFTTGRIIFIALFVVAFVIAMVWSYGKEKNIRDIHFKKSYKILIALILFLVLQFLIVKVRRFL